MDALYLAELRNGELHSSDGALANANPEVWIPKSLLVVEAVCKLIDQPVSDFLAKGIIDQAETYKETADRAVKQRVKQLIENARNFYSGIGEDDSGQLVEKDTKTHQQRRVVVDPETVEVLRAYLVRSAERAAALQIELPKDAYLFSQEVDGSSFLIPDSVTQRYDRMAERLGIDTTLHNLRHYSATKLISAGVDLRTVAGRLGHSGGGATTLRRYAAWVAEADQRAATTLKGRMPATPLALIPEVKLVGRVSAGDGTVKSPATESAGGISAAAEQDPYHRIASDLRAAIACGALEVGDPLPTLKTLAARYSVAESTRTPRHCRTRRGRANRGRPRPTCGRPGDGRRRRSEQKRSTGID